MSNPANPKSQREHMLQSSFLGKKRDGWCLHLRYGKATELRLHLTVEELRELQATLEESLHYAELENAK